MSVETIWAREFECYIGRAGVEIWDVRSPEEYAKKHIRGAKNMSYQSYEDCEMQAENCMDKEKTYILYCDRGGLSMAFARELDKKGYHVKSVIGGIMAYRGNDLECFKSND